MYLKIFEYKIKSFSNFCEFLTGITILNLYYMIFIMNYNNYWIHVPIDANKISKLNQ